MIIDVPYAFTAFVVPKGKRKEVETTLHGKIPVEVREASDETAPLVLRWHQKARLFGDGPDELPPTDYRRHGPAGVLYTPVFEHVSRQPRRHVSVEEMLANVGRGHGGATNPLFAGETFAAEGLNPTSASVEGVVAIRSSDEDAVVAKIRAAAADLLAVDGMLFGVAENAEPVYVLQPFNDFDRQSGERYKGCAIKTTRLRDIPVVERDVRKHFRVDQIVEVLAAAEDKGAALVEYDPDEPDSFSSMFREFVEVVDPSALLWRHDQGPYLRNWMTNRLAFDKNDIHEQPPRTMFAYGEVRDGLKAGVSGTELCNLMEAYAATLIPRFEDEDGDDFWFRHAAEKRREILDEVEAFNFCPLPEEVPAYLPGPKP